MELIHVKYKFIKGNNQKTLHALDQFDTFQTFEDMMRFLVQSRKPINGSILMSDGVITNLVNDGLITEQMGKDLKSLDLDETGKPKLSTYKSGGSSKTSARAKATKKYFQTLADIKPTKINTTASPKINIKGLTFGD